MTILFVDTSYVFEKKKRKKKPLSAGLQNPKHVNAKLQNPKNDWAFTAVQHEYTDNQWTVKKKADRNKTTNQNART